MKVFFGSVFYENHWHSYAETHLPCQGGDHLFCEITRNAHPQEFSSVEEAESFTKEFVVSVVAQAQSDGIPLYLSQDEGKLILAYKDEGLD